MSFLEIITSFLFLAMVLLAYKYIQQLRFLSQFPNSGRTLPIIGDAHLFINSAPEEMVPLIMDLLGRDPEWRKCALYLGPKPMLVVYHPETVAPLLKSNSNIEKGDEYRMLLPWLGSGLLISTGERWRQRRKLLTPTFHFKILEDSLEIFNRNSDTLSELLLLDGGHGSKAIDLFPYLCRCTLDILLESAMGEKMDLQHNQESPYARAKGDISHIMQHRQKSPWLHPDWLFALSPTKREQDRCLDVIHGFTRSVIKARKNNVEAINKSKNKKLAFLDLLLTVRNAVGEPLHDQELQEEVDTFMVGGSDSTACSLSWTLLLLANHPEIQDKIIEEQREIFGMDQEQDVQLEHLNKMQYLECCIKESLRLYPGVPMITRRIEKELIIDGITVPKGTTVMVNIYVLHRNPLVWDNPDEFHPERFLPDSSMGVNRHPYAYVPFSAGLRNCIGQRFALMEEKTVLSKLLRKVEVIAAQRIEDVKPVVEIVTKPKGEIRAYFKPRIT